MHKVGRKFEYQALLYLQNQGLTLIAQNYTCRNGEIDLIMQDISDFVFIEVKARNSIKYGGSYYSISYSKQKKIIDSALIFIQQNNLNINHAGYRFDAVLFENSRINWLQNIIQLNDNY